MRGWYEDKFRSAPPSYAELVSAVQRGSPPPENPPKITVDRAQGLLRVENAPPVPLTPVEFAAVCLQFEGASSHGDMAERLLALKVATLGGNAPAWLHDFQSSERYFEPKKNKEPALLALPDAIDVLRKTLSSARAKLARHPMLAPHAGRLLPKRQIATDYRSLRFAGPALPHPPTPA